MLQEELAMLQTERKAKRGSLVFLPIKKPDTRMNFAKIGSD